LKTRMIGVASILSLALLLSAAPTFAATHSASSDSSAPVQLAKTMTKSEATKMHEKEQAKKKAAAKETKKHETKSGGGGGGTTHKSTTSKKSTKTQKHK